MGNFDSQRRTDACLITLGIVLIGLMTIVFGSLIAKAVDSTFNFDVADEYTADSTITISGNEAKLAQVDKTDDDNDGVGGWGAATLDNTEFSSDHMEITSFTADNAWEFPDSRSSTGWIDMSSNILLLHMDESDSSAITFADSSGRGNDGVCDDVGSVDCPTGGADGRLVRAADFDGATQYVDLGDDLTDFEDLTDEISISFWVNIDSWKDWGSYIGHMQNGVNSKAWIVGSNSVDGEIYFNVTNESNSGVTVGTGTGDIWERGKWQHFAGTYDGTTIRVYRNGVEVDSGAQTGNIKDMSGVTQANWIGKLNHTGQEEIDAQMDEIAVWNTALDAATIADIYDRQSKALQFGGYLESRVIDAGASSTWTTLDWDMNSPYGAELPDNTGSDSGYSADSVSMTNNKVLLHMNALTSDAGDDIAEDTSGNDNDAVCDDSSSRCPTVSDGLFGNSYHFTTSSNDYIDLGEETDTDLGGTDDVSMSMWFKAPNVSHSSQRTLFASRKTGSWGTASTPGFLLIMCPSGSNCGSGTVKGSLYLGIQGNPDGGNSYAAIRTNDDFDDDEWHHLVIRWDRDGGDGAEIWVDGVEQATSLNTGSWANLVGDVIDPTTYLINSVVGSRNTSGSTFDREFDGYIDEFAFFKGRYLSDAEIADLYLRGVSKVHFQVRSCDDSACSGEGYLGPDGTDDTYFSAATDSDLSSDLTAVPIGDNRYFQYKAILESGDSSYNPELDSVAIGPTGYPTNRPTVYNDADGTLIDFSALTGFADSYDNAGVACATTSECEVEYQISNDGTNWYYWNGSNWVEDGDDSGTYETETSDASTINTNISQFVTDVGVGTFYFKAFLHSNGSAQTTLNSVTPSYDLPYFTIADTSVGEADGTLSASVSLVGGNANGYSIDYATADNTATAGSDYTAKSATTLTWTAGQTGAKTATVAITSDALDEAAESLYLNLTSNSAGTTVSDAQGEYTITDDDDPPSLSIADVAVAEGDDAVTATFTVSLDAASGQTVTVDYVTSNGTATAGSDYTAASGTLTFVASDTTETFDVTVAADNVADGTETFTVTLSDPTNATIGDDTATGTITDTDSASVTVTESGGTTAMAEGAVDTYTIVLGSEPTDDVVITPANEAAQLTFAPASLTFTAANWNEAQTITVTGFDDTTVEGEHTATATHTVTSATDTDYDGIAVSDVVATITDNDTAEDGRGAGGSGGDSSPAAARNMAANIQARLEARNEIVEGLLPAAGPSSGAAADPNSERVINLPGNTTVNQLLNEEFGVEKRLKNRVELGKSEETGVLTVGEGVELKGELNDLALILRGETQALDGLGRPLSDLTIKAPKIVPRGNAAAQPPVGLEHKIGIDIDTGRDRVNLTTEAAVIAPLPVGTNLDANLEVWFLNEETGEFEFLTDSIILDTNDHTLTFFTDHFTYFVVVENKVGSLFTDISGHWAEDAIIRLERMGIVKGQSRHIFNPDAEINRAELLTLGLRAFELVVGEEATDAYADLPRDHWANASVATATSLGLVSGYPDGTFKPGQTVNFVEALKVLLEATGMEFAASEPWYQSYLNFALSEAIVPLFKANELDSPMTRADAADLLDKLVRLN